jgi:Transposase DDE domain group 1
VKVMGRWSVKTVDVRADGTGLCSRTGTSLLALVADRVGLTAGFCDALDGIRERRGGHEPGRVFCDLAVMLADGGRCVSDLAALAGQGLLFGDVASVSTARRVVLSVGEAELAAIRVARARARARAWAAGATPERVILDFDATPIGVHSEKEHAAGHYKGGFGFNPLVVSCGREILAGTLRPGNAGANNAEDHLELLDLALAQLPHSALDGEILARSDSAGASHDLADACRETGIRFSFGYPISEPVREALLALEESAWRRAIDHDGEEREGAWVSELTGRVNLADWPEGTRLICRRERPHPGAQLSFTDLHGHRFQCFITDQTSQDIAALEGDHRQHARVEDRIKTLEGDRR